MPISNQTLKYIKSLHVRKFRQKYNNFIAEGDKIVSEIIQNAPNLIERIFAIPSWVENNVQLVDSIISNFQPITEEELKKISGLVTPNQIFAIVKQPEIIIDPAIVQTDWSLYLDGIQDPGNMGTILRIADWFGIKHVFCAPNCVEIYSPKVVQASMGAFLRIVGTTQHLNDLRSQFPALPVYGAVLHGENIFHFPVTRSGILVIGNESKGISEEIEKILTHRISIPAGKAGGAESLNAAVATGILVAVFKNLS